MKKTKLYRSIQKLIAYFLLISFTLLNTTNNLYAETNPTLLPSQEMKPLDIVQSLKLPQELGTVQESFLPTNPEGLMV